MYYNQKSEKYQTVDTYYYDQLDDEGHWTQKVQPRRIAHSYQCLRSSKRCYSFRTSRPKNDSATAVVPGESLIGNRRKGARGVGDYLESYKAAVRSLDDEAGQVSGNSGYGIMDKGHRFVSQRVRSKIAYLQGQTRFTVREEDQKPQSLTRPFKAAVWLSVHPAFIMPGEENRLPRAVANTIQELAVSTIPDKIEGSLGQDLVDIAELPRIVRHLASVGREMSSLQKAWAALSKKVRHAIDTCIRDRSAAPRWALRAAGSGYLEWMFVLQPYIEDMQAVMRFLSSTSSSMLQRYSCTKEKLALDRAAVNGSAYSGGGYSWRSFGRPLSGRFEGREQFSVHLAIAWVRRGPLPSDGQFARTAVEMNRKLGIWYPSLLWDLTPWTWLIDWALHLGKSIDGTYAVSNSDYRPAYAWATVRNTISCHGRFGTFETPDIWLESNYFQVASKSLCRYPVQVTGVVKPSFSALSSAQKAILAALGLSHIKK